MSDVANGDGDPTHGAKSAVDAELERELQDALGDQSVFDLLEKEDRAQRGATDTRKGTVLAIHGEDIFVDFGGKTQGLLSSRVFDEEQELPKVGDPIEVVVEGYDEDEGLMMLTLPGAVKEADWDSVSVGQIVEGRVTGHNKGGLELTINGIRAFMPISQVEIFRIEDLQPYVDQKFKCEIIECDRANENLLVSRRNILEREAAEKREEAFNSLAEGKTVKGLVRNIQPYGAFVDIGGVDGLLHIKDMSYKHVDKPEDIVSIGQTIEVMVLKIDSDSRKISLGLKQAMPDPWDGVEDRYPPGTLVSVRVSRLMDFGAFVELEEGVEGLVPIGEITFARRIRHPSDELSEGQVVQVSVMSVDPERKRVGLSIKQAGPDPWTGASVRWPVDSTATGTVTRTTDFGAFVRLTEGVEGLIHISELSDQHVKSVSEVVKEGDTVQARVLSVDEAQRRIGLSIKALKNAPDYTGQADDAVAPPPEKTPRRKKKLRGGL